MSANTRRAVAVLSIALLTLALSPSGGAVQSCAYNSATFTVAVVLEAAETVTISLGPVGEILVNDQTCGSATAANTTAIAVRGSTGDETVQVSQIGAGGRFPPAVEFTISLSEGSSDRVAVVGDASDETIDVNEKGFDLEGDGRLNLAVSGIERFEVDAGGGNDTVGAGGASGSLFSPITIRGGDGNDTLIGGTAADDNLYGDAGNDTLDGGPQADLLDGGPGADSCVADALDTVVSCGRSLSLDPVHGRAWEEIAVTGEDWDPGLGDVAVYLDRADIGVLDPLAVTTPQADGSISTPFDVPPRSPGEYTVVACQGCSDLDAVEATYPFSIDPSVPVPSLTLQPASGAVGDRVRVTGTRFGPDGGPIDVYFDSADVSAGPVATASPGSDGTFQGAFAVPQRPPGTYPVLACQGCGDPDALAASETFTVVEVPTGPPSLRLRPGSGGAGDRIEVVGRGWSPGAGEVMIYLDPSDPPTGKPAARAFPNANGVVRTGFAIPKHEGGSFTVLACQRCGALDAVAASATLAIEGASPPRLPWIGAGLALLVAVAALFLRWKRPWVRSSAGRVRAELAAGESEVQVTVEAGSTPARAVGLVPHLDLGVQQIEELVHP